MSEKVVISMLVWYAAAEDLNPLDIVDGFDGLEEKRCSLHIPKYKILSQFFSNKP